MPQKMADNNRHCSVAFDALVLLAPLMVNSLLVVLFARVSASHAALYVLFQLLFVIVPGYGLGKAVLRMNLRPLETVILGYPLAHGVLFPLFWVGAVFRLPYLPFLVPILGIFLAARKPTGLDLLPEEPAISRPAFLALCGAGLAALLGFTLDLRPPVGAETLFIYKDYELATGKLFSIMRFLDGMPLTDFRIEGFGFAYHILQMIPQAYFAWLTDVPPYTVAFALDPQFTMVFIVGAALAGSRVLARLSKHASLWTPLLLLFGTGLTWLGFHNFQLLASPLTYFFSFPFFLLFLFYAQGFLSGQLEKLNPFYAAGLYLAAAGSKSVLGLLLPLALAPVFLLRLAQRRLSREHWIMLALVVAAALLLKATMYPSTGQALLRPKGWGQTVFDIVEVTVVILAVPETLFIVALASFSKPLRVRLAGRRQFLLFSASFVLIASALAGAIDFVGGHEYFCWYSRCLLLLFAALAIGYAFEKRHRLAMALGVMLLLIGAYHMRYFLALKTYGSLFGKPINATLFDEPTATMDAHEWEGLLWTSRNLPRSALMFSNRTTCVYTYRRGNERVTAKEAYYSYAAFSGMQSWTHDTEWVQNSEERDRRLALVKRFLVSEDPREQSELLQRIPTRYFLQCLRFDSRSYAAIPGLRKIYANPSIVVYEIDRSSPFVSQEKT